MVAYPSALKLAVDTFKSATAIHGKCPGYAVNAVVADPSITSPYFAVLIGK
jgi:hypothetical protein